MTDRALKNAQKRRDDLAADINKTNQHLEGLRKSLSEVEKFISEWHAYAGAEQDSVAGPELNSGVDTTYPQATRVSETVLGTDSPPSPLPPPPPKNPDKAQVGAMAKILMIEKGRPLARSELFKQLQRAGVHIYGKDPEMVLSTMMWRMKEDFVRLPGHGYWIKELPWLPANYRPGDSVQPELEDLEAAASATFGGGD
ncbi:hypothetical protein [Bradyrhizobium ottawaense]|uniref:hypothetical protein n=1 Tax=Bradyrhizobium ottawaense TaxID=931866 RepID=UPI001BACA523|nr:hypothetical protein [Bradyrhizobium ottawaense]MBR1362077.1 hypothetical protein [Bradyrhizobium ottawaense]